MADPTSAAAPAAAAGAPVGVVTPTAPSLLGPDGKLSVAAVRKAYPMYDSLSDDQLLMGLHKTLYPNTTARQFYGAVNYDTDAAKLSPLNDMGPFDKFAAAYGKTTSDVLDTGKRLGNMVGIGDYDQQAAAEDQRIGAPLTKTGPGFAGKLVGDLALTAVPAAKGAQLVGRGVGAAGAALPNALARMAVKGAAPLAGAAVAGAGTGAALSPDDMSGGAEVGAALAPVGELAGRVAQGAYQGGKAVIEPLWQAGRDRILKRTLERFASDPSSLQRAAMPEVHVPGYTPTLAEATGDTGLAQLQRGASTAMPGVANALADANSQRVGAYKTALDDLAGNDGKRQFFEANRAGNASQNYSAAYGAGMPGMTPELQDTFDALLQRPAIAKAIPTAQEIAANKGVSIDDPGGSVEGMHYVKKALDNQMSSLATGGHTEMGSSVSDAQKAFIAALREASPGYGKALDQYAADSAPINQMAVGQRLRDTMLPALGDFSPDLTRTRPQQYAQALRDSAQTARSATGLDSATIENVLDPAQLQTVQGVAKDAARYTNAQEAGKAPGSPTAQYLGAQNILQQALGPLGLPAAGLDTALGRAAAGVMSIPFKATSSKVEEQLARVLRDPVFAAQIAATKDAAPLIAKLQPGAANAAVVTGDNK